MKMKKNRIIMMATVCAMLAICAMLASYCPKKETALDAAKLRTIVSDETTVVSTQQGCIQGFLDGEVYTFLGIPYAKAERFMPPQSPDKFEGIRMCRTYGPKALQGQTLDYRDLSSDYDFAFQFIYEPMDEENCLVLNIWSRGINDPAKRPVFVWFHGGGFSSGSGHDLPCYEGRALAEIGDVVVVTLNHRLNVLGYTDLRGLGGKYAESVNLGQQDLVKALEWIHENIAAFGGDSGNVTIGGQSGGGGKVSNVLAMPSARGLFHKAIVQSGSNMPFQENEASIAFGLTFAKELGVSPGNTEKLDTFTYEELVAASRRASSRTGGVGFGGALPTLDGKIITETPIAPELSRDIPMIVGTNLYEFSYGAAKPETTLDEAHAKLVERFGDAAKADQYMDEYKAAFPHMEPRDLLCTDYFFRPGAAEQVSAKSAQKAAPVYCFLFAWKPEGSDVGASHGMELPFMFHNIDLQREMTRASEKAYKLSDLMSASWIAFFHTGDPNVEGLPKWEAYTEENGAVMFFDNTCHLEHHHDDALLKYQTGRMF
jgi:para-nitrobenzyl esterase